MTLRVVEERDDTYTTASSGALGAIRMQACSPSSLASSTAKRAGGRSREKARETHSRGRRLEREWLVVFPRLWSVRSGDFLPFSFFFSSSLALAMGPQFQLGTRGFLFPPTWVLKPSKLLLLVAAAVCCCCLLPADVGRGMFLAMLNLAAFEES